MNLIYKNNTYPIPDFLVDWYLCNGCLFVTAPDMDESQFERRNNLMEDFKATLPVVLASKVSVALHCFFIYPFSGVVKIQ